MGRRTGGRAGTLREAGRSRRSPGPRRDPGGRASLRLGAPPHHGRAGAAPQPRSGGMSPAAALPHQRRVLVAVLSGIATVLTLLAMMAVWVNRQALNTDAWTNTSGRLLEDKHVQAAVSTFMVDQLFSSVDVGAEIQKVLPPQASALAGPAAAGLQQLAGQVAPRLLASPKVHEAWRTANRTAHKELLTVLNGGHAAISTDNGEVVLNLRPLVDQLAGSLGVQKQ